MANRYPFPQDPRQARAGVVPNNVTGFPNIHVWQQQVHHPQPPASFAQTNSLQQVPDELKHREYLKQQQKLRLMTVASHKKPVSADKLIENLLDKKDTFRPKTTQQPISSPSTHCQTSVQPSLPGQTALMSGSVRSLGYPQHISPSFSTQPSTNSDMSTSNVVAQLGRESAIYKSSGASPSGANQFDVCQGIQLPTWLSNVPHLYRQIWIYSGQDNGLVDTSKIFPLLLTSGLPTDVLGYIWSLANQKVAGQLTEQELYIVLALVGLAQSGCTFNNLSVLNLIPQAPIPNLNISSIHSTGQTAECPSASSQGTYQLEENYTQAATADINDVQTAVPLKKVEEDLEEFSDFQSASCVGNSSPPSPPSPSLPLQDSPIHIKDSTPTVAFQGGSSGEGHTKLSSIFSLGISRGVGSRLANHSLGAPKQSKGRHHKHHHHHHHHHHQHPNQQRTPQVVATDQEAEDEFSDFQQAKDVSIYDKTEGDGIFPKCVLKSPTSKTYKLKESAIRMEERQDGRLECSIEGESTSLPEMAEPVSVQGGDESGAEAEISTPTVTAAAAAAASGLSVGEDRYSALRALSLADQEVSTSEQVASDDFGDFLSAEQSAVDESFAALATREVSAVLSDGGLTVWPGEAAPDTQNAEFQLSDWGEFETVPPASGAPVPESAAGQFAPQLLGSSLESALSGLTFSASDSDSSWKTIQQTNSSGLHFLTASPEPSIVTSENWTESQDENSQTHSTDKGYGLSFLGKIYDDHNSSFRNTKNGLSVLENEQQADSASLTIKAEDEDEEFGDFVGPQTWPEESKMPAKGVALENLSVLGVKDVAFDSQSVSSLELPALSRHGSLRSLDLKIGSVSSDRAVCLQPWDSSPQGIDLQIKEWCRCLQSCLQLLQAALAVFTNISSESVEEEVMASYEGKEYLLNLLEVYGICKRVKHSSSQVTSDSKLDSILAEADIVWSSMETYFCKANIKVEVEFGCTSEGGSGQEPPVACGICLAGVGGDAVPEANVNTYPLEYAGQLYHAACANLWVNCVDCRLPALVPTNSLL